MIDATTFNSFDAWQLSDGDIRLTVIPEWGGKIAELFDLRRKREWLFHNLTLPWRRPQYDANYVREYDVGGFDECFPTVGPCNYPSTPWKGIALPDHGEVWALPWKAHASEDRLHLHTFGVRLPYRMEKEIQLLGDGRVRLDYTVSNLTSFPMPFLWCSHPMLSARPGMRLDVPVKEMRIYSTHSFPAKAGDLVNWPHTGDQDLSCVPGPDAGIAIKLFAKAPAEGWVRLSDPVDKASLSFFFDPALVTHLGLWLNYGGWAGAPKAPPYFNIGIELGIGAPDTLEEAVNHWKEFGVLLPSSSHRWWQEIEIA